MRTTIRGAAAGIAVGLILLSAPARGGDDETVRVATYNIRHGVGTDDKLDLDRTATVLKDLGADYIGLQEVDERARRSGGVDQADALGERLGMRAAFGPFMNYQGGRYGLAILSRHPILNARVVPLPEGGEPRVALAVDVRPPGGSTVTLVNAHLDWAKDDAARFRQAQALKAALDALPGPYLLVGDLNDEPGSRTLRLLAEGCVEADKPADARFTFPAPDPAVEIDFLFAGPAARWTVDRVRVVEEPTASDHRPVVATLRLTAPAPETPLPGDAAPKTAAPTDQGEAGPAD